jgi:hypothetical protein
MAGVEVVIDPELSCFGSVILIRNVVDPVVRPCPAVSGRVQPSPTSQLLGVCGVAQNHDRSGGVRDAKGIVLVADFVVNPVTGG